MRTLNDPNYRVKTWAETLPTYSNEVMGTRLTYMGAYLGRAGGVCMLLRAGQHLETMEHIVECQENMVESEKQQRLRKDKAGV